MPLFVGAIGFGYANEKKRSLCRCRVYITFRTGHEFCNYPSFIINQTCSENEINYSWFGFGLENFIQSLKEHSKRYAEAGIVRPHHREVASFVASGPNFIFYVAFQPDVIKEDDEPNFDYMQVGFIFEEMPFNNRKFIEFYKKVGLEEPNFVHYEKESFNVEVLNIENKNFDLEKEAFVVYRDYGSVANIFKIPPNSLMVVTKCKHTQIFKKPYRNYL